MDPEACLKRVGEALEENDIREAIDGMNDFCEWAKKGGFVTTLQTALAMTYALVLHDITHNEVKQAKQELRQGGV